MNYGFNHDQFQEDIDDLTKYLGGFGKSFLKSPKKVQGNQIGFFKEMHVRFMLMLVEMGISKVIRMAIVFIVLLALFVPLFIYAQADVKFILIIGFVIFYVWMMMDHLVVDGKPVDTAAKVIVKVHEVIIDILSELNPFKKEEKKK